MTQSLVLKGNICYSRDSRTLEYAENGYLVCENGLSAGVFGQLPEQYRALPLVDHGQALIVPGLTDLHVHASQYALRGLGMDLELLDWLHAHVFPEEARFSDLDYAQQAYSLFVEDMKNSPNTRACVFATSHTAATVLLMDMLEQSGLLTMVGRVNMDRNSPPALQEASAEASINETVDWLQAVSGRYANTMPILTPRFIPACSDALMARLRHIQEEYRLPLQSHLSENTNENVLVQQLCPESASYADAYRRFGLFGGDVPTVMAHCVWVSEEERAMMRDRGVFVAHCPQSNANLASGIAPVRQMLAMGIPMGLGSDVAGGCHVSIFRAMSDAIQASKIRWRLVCQEDAPLTMAEAFYLGTMGGGAFFAHHGPPGQSGKTGPSGLSGLSGLSGKTGSFLPGYELDALVIDDSDLLLPCAQSLPERLTRAVYFAHKRHLRQKYVRGKAILP